MNAKLASIVLASTALASVAAVGLSPAARAAPTAPVQVAGGGSGTVANLKAIRAEYVDLDGNHYHEDTLCFLRNQSATDPIVLREVFVLGPGGLQDVMGVGTALVGTVIEPLGEVRFWIDDGIAGVAPQTSVSATGVRTAVFSWLGPHDALRLTGKIQRSNHSSSNDHPDVHFPVEGYDLNL